MGRSISFRRSKTEDPTADRKAVVRNLLEKTTLEALRNNEYKDVNGNIISKSSSVFMPFLVTKSNKAQLSRISPILLAQDGNVLWTLSVRSKRQLMEGTSVVP